MSQTTAKLGLTCLFVGALAACAADPSMTDDEPIDGEIEEGVPGGDSERSSDKAVNRMYVEWCRSPASAGASGKPICRPYNFNTVDWDNDFAECKRDIRYVCGAGWFYMRNSLGWFYTNTWTP